MLWEPSQDRIQKSQMNLFSQRLQKKYNKDFSNYNELHHFSIHSSDEFWSEILEYYPVKYTGSTSPVNTDYGFKEYGWFPHLKLNFAQNLLENANPQNIALNFIHESGLKKQYNYQQLKIQVAQLQSYLEAFIKEGDVLAAYMPNIPETVISMLATTANGATFTSTSSDFGVEGVIDRFSQSKPKVLVAAAGYSYNGKYFDQSSKLIEIQKQLPSIEHILIVDFLEKSPDISQIPKAKMWTEAFQNSEKNQPVYTLMPFNSPLYIMYSSGTTGKPKCIVHSVGGTLLQHIKELGLHTNLSSDKNIFYFTTCGWMMWNWLVSSLFFGAQVTLYEGSPAHPDLKDFIQIINREKIHYFGTSPKFLKALEDNFSDLNLEFPTLETLLSTGAPLLPEQFDYVYNALKSDVQVASICGGTDIVGCFMLGNPLLPVNRGEIQCLGLGMDVACFDENGLEVFDKEGELVCKKSFPSRPIYFLNDEKNEKLNKAYFNKYENIWHHGDFITITNKKAIKVFGRSDATLNPGGVRIGTAEIYRQTESLNYLEDSLCVGQNQEGDVDVVLFVKMKQHEDLTPERKLEIKKLIRKNTTPRHMPRHIYAIQDIPYTRSGKKMELAISRIINNKELTNIEAVSNPECLDEYKKFRI